MRCHRCKNRVLQKSGELTRVRTDGPIVFTEDGRCLAKCYWCKEPIELPLQLQKGLAVPGETFLLREDSNTKKG